MIRLPTRGKKFSRKRRAWRPRSPCWPASSTPPFSITGFALGAELPARQQALQHHHAGHRPREVIELALRSEPELSAAVAADICAVQERDSGRRPLLHALLYLKGFHALQGYRVANWLWRQGRRALALYCKTRSPWCSGSMCTRPRASARASCSTTPPASSSGNRRHRERRLHPAERDPGDRQGERRLPSQDPGRGDDRGGGQGARTLKRASAPRFVPAAW